MESGITFGSPVSSFTLYVIDGTFGKSLVTFLGVTLHFHLLLLKPESV